MSIVPSNRGALRWVRYALTHGRFARPHIPGGVVSFSFDDFPASAAQTAGPLLEEEGWRGTFYLSPGLQGGETSVGTICTWDEVERLSRAGHEIGNHTHSHFCCTNAPDNALSDEYELSHRELRRFAGSNHFAFPSGAYDFSAASFLSRKFKTLRTVNHGINAIVTDLNLLKANPLYYPVNLGKLALLLTLTRWLRGWLILYTHDVAPTPSRWGCTPEEFSAVIAAVKRAGVQVDTVGNVYRRIAKNS